MAIFSLSVPKLFPLAGPSAVRLVWIDISVAKAIGAARGVSACRWRWWSRWGGVGDAGVGLGPGLEAGLPPHIPEEPTIYMVPAVGTAVQNLPTQTLHVPPGCHVPRIQAPGVVWLYIS